MSGVDQMKLPGNTARSPEERNIPWSQQVDEASYENLASPTTDDSSAANQSSMQFQYPPFNAKENQNVAWSAFNKPKKSTNNYDTNKKYGKTGLHIKRDDYQPNNAWGARRVIAENSSSNINRIARNDDSYSSGKVENRSNEPIEENKTTTAPTVAAPKKTTWASIASQPAKLASRTTLTTSSHKKKGPGMPPPPMVPGKHNLDVNTWDLPNNNPPPIPSPPPPIDLACSDVNSDFSLTIVSEPALGARPEKPHKNTEVTQKDEQRIPFGNNSNYGRVRNSPNGHARKNWTTQGPLQPQRPISNVPTAASVPLVPTVRRSEINSASRYIERRPNYPSNRTDYDSNARTYDYRDENSPRIADRASNVIEVCGDPQALLDELRDKNDYNPTEIDLERAALARFFVIKSYSEDDIHRSIKYEIWCSTDHGNKRLDDAFKERHEEGGNILLFFSVNGSGHFCGMAQMMTAVDYNSTSSVWSQDKWKGKFKVKWIYVKDVPNTKLRHIRLENNDNKSVTHSRDTQEVPNAKGIEVLQILHSYKHSTSIFDDFSHYEKKQEEEVSSKRPNMYAHESSGSLQIQSPINRHFNRQNDDRDREIRDTRGTITGTAQKYFDRGSTGFRDRNNIHRNCGFHTNYSNNEFRRGFDSQRTIGMDYQHKDSVEADRDNEYGGVRHASKYEYGRWTDDHTQANKSRLSNRDREFNSEQNKTDTRFRAGLVKDNDKERIRTVEY